jgi:hypothetical protein
MWYSFTDTSFFSGLNLGKNYEYEKRFYTVISAGAPFLLGQIEEIYVGQKGIEPHNSTI